MAHLNSVTKRDFLFLAVSTVEVGSEVSGNRCGEGAIKNLHLISDVKHIHHHT